MTLTVRCGGQRPAPEGALGHMDAVGEHGRDLPLDHVADHGEDLLNHGVELRACMHGDEGEGKGGKVRGQEAAAARGEGERAELPVQDHLTHLLLEQQRRVHGLDRLEGSALAGL